MILQCSFFPVFFIPRMTTPVLRAAGGFLGLPEGPILGPRRQEQTVSRCGSGISICAAESPDGFFVSAIPLASGVSQRLSCFRRCGGEMIKSGPSNESQLEPEVLDRLTFGAESEIPQLRCLWVRFGAGRDGLLLVPLRVSDVTSSERLPARRDALLVQRASQGHQTRG